jgi:hypothetical protein
VLHCPQSMPWSLGRPMTSVLFPHDCDNVPISLYTHMRTFSEWLKVKESVGVGLPVGPGKKLPRLADAQWQGAPGGTGSQGQKKGPVKSKD